MSAARYAFRLLTFAAAVKAEREMRGLTFTQAAAASGVARPAIFRAEAGQSIQVASFLGLCRWLGANPFDFLDDVSRGNGETAERRQDQGYVA
jgi:transcriptional regulator with XRE-family HTH domain